MRWHVLAALSAGVCLPTMLFGGEIPALQRYEGPLRPGVVITRENWERFLPELRKVLPPSKVKWYANGVKAELVTMPIVRTTYLPLTKGQLEATWKYAGTARVGPDNQLHGYVAGVPFPHPETAAQVVWNCHPAMVARSGSHDDFGFFNQWNYYQGNKYEKHFVIELYNRRYRGRTDIPPLGDLPEFTKNGVLYKESFVVHEPHEVRGYSNVRIRYWDIRRADESYAYVPAIRRVRRLTGSDLTDPLLGSDAVLDDFEGWRQKITPRMRFRVIAHKEMLFPQVLVLDRNTGWRRIPQHPYDYRKQGPCFPVKWEFRPCWVVEVVINDPDYVYSKRILYVDSTPLEKGGRFYFYWGEHYDQRGRLFRASGQVQLGANREGFQGPIAYMSMNYLTNHYTLMDGYSFYIKDFDRVFPLSGEVFTLRGLLRRAR